MKRLGVDVGGTFTDFFYIDEETGAIVLNKVPTTPTDPSVGVMAGALEVCDMAGVPASGIDQFFHGTTIATNIIIEHNGSKTGMITTEGYRDIIYIARHKRPLNFSLRQDLPWQKHVLVDRRNRLPVHERVIAPQGEVLVPLAEDEVREAVRKLKAEQVESIAVCFLFSFLNPEHELRVREIIEEEWPGVYVSLSHEVIPQFREYYRFTTTCLNCYMGPKVSRYVNNLASAMKQEGFGAELHLMQSSGGVATLEGALSRPVTLLMSGPIAGLIGGIWAGRNAGFANVITLDVGGTSADIGVAPSGEMRMKHLLDTKIGDYDAMVPMVDIDTIGAGGGSVAFVDEGGMFRVGPRSAGAEPGPACYRRGGLEPTATDANLTLGRLNPNNFLGGRMTLDPSLSEKAFDDHLLPQLNMDRVDAALGAIKILEAAMMNSIEMNSVRKGYDPRDFALVAFGGAGPLHACQIARELSIPAVVIPPNPGITSALGLLATDIAYDYSKTELMFISDPDLEKLSADFAELEREATERLRKDGMSDDRIVLQRLADCRYFGQGYELRVGVDSGGAITGATITSLRDAFDQAHLQQYKTLNPESEVQIVNIRVMGFGGMPKLEWQPLGKGKAVPVDGALTARREVVFQVDGATREFDTPIMTGRSSLPATR
ncbi:MAG: hydantoinase/oxoprolinase family protein [Thermoleophilia bacterium]|nr:hydantoinase/oxoprolinase family protein [Thermoleophilia bacterium]